MSNSKLYILWFFLLSLLILSWSISLSKFDFIYEKLNNTQLEQKIQSIIDNVNTLDQDINTTDRAFEYVISKSDSITDWSTNNIDFKALGEIKETGIYNLSSIIYLVWKEQKDNTNISYLIPLKRNFNQENIYLINNAFNNVYFPKNYTPSRNITNYAININIKENDFIIYFNKDSEDTLKNGWKYLLPFIYIIALIGLLILSYLSISKFNIYYYYKIIIWLGTLVLAYFILIPEIPFTQEFYLFQPYSFANSQISSLAGLLITVLIIYNGFFFSLKLLEKANLNFNLTQSIIAQKGAFLGLVLILFFIKNILINSTSNFINLKGDIPHYQDIIIIIIFGILILLFIRSIIFILSHSKIEQTKKYLRNIVLAYIPTTIIIVIIDWHFIILPIFIMIVNWLLSVKNSYYFSKQFIRLSLIFLASIFIVGITEYISSEKELNDSSLRLSNYQIENNRLAEYLIKELDTKIVQDSSLMGLLYQLPQSERNIYDYIRMQYFTGFWAQYENDITICSSIFENENNICSCDSFFNPKIQSAIKRIEKSHFTVNQDYGINHYLGKFSFTNEKDSSIIDLYILLKPIEQHKNLGYPTILLSKEIEKETDENFYSYAKYVQGNLMSHSGDYNYSLKYNFPSDLKDKQLFRKNGFYHLIEYQGDGSYNIISSKQQDIFNYLIILSYIFILYVLAFYSFDLIKALIFKELNFQASLKNKLRISFLGLLIITFVSIASAIIYKSTELSTKNQKNILEEKMQSVLVELKHKLSQTNNIKSLNVDYLNYLLIKFSNVFFTDINLYDLSGRLIASSRPEVFERGLIGNRMHPIAFNTVVRKKRSYLTHTEQIGTQNYLSSYTPIKSSKNEIIAYLNLPYFAKDKEIKSDVTSLITAFLNIFVFLFLVTSLLSIVISARITLPLVIIQKKLKSFGLGKNNEAIDYKSNDEIGALIKEYNRTVEELNTNIELLAQKEREGAWKEMAKQIAHEIKNPLTPMKLSIQHLKYVWQDDRPDKEQKLNDTVDLIVRQIDNLAEIATAFSDFSKMTVAKKKPFNLIRLIQEQIDLHAKEVSIKLIAKEDALFEVFADEQQINRVYQNILTNSIQAIPNKEEAKISIHIWKEKQSIYTKICDNGTGMSKEIQERLFEPNFTTKNSGMGLGLAIVKQIIKNNSGEITFESTENKGTCFTISLQNHNQKK